MAAADARVSLGAGKGVQQLIVGDPKVVAIESEILYAYACPGQRATGFFVLHVGGKVYGIRELNATMLAVSYDQVLRQLEMRGKHAVPFTDEQDAEAIAVAYRDVFYNYGPEGVHLGVSGEVFDQALHQARVTWAPDGDAGFDDGSYVLQFDVQDRVRVIAFRSADGGGVEAGSLREVWMPADVFYGTLERWAQAFLEEWENTPKAE